MIRVTKLAAQGDVLFRRVEKLPANAQRVKRKGRVVVAHSETGHDHAIDDLGVVRYEIGDPIVCYLQVNGLHADVVHHRAHDTHATLRLEGGGSIWEVRRQREFSPEGWRVVQD